MTGTSVTSTAPWRRFPESQRRPPDLRDVFKQRLSEQQGQAVLASARVAVATFLRDRLKHLEQSPKRAFRGFRVGHWPQRRVLQEALDQSSRDRVVAACLGVMMLEHDAKTEGILAVALESNEGEVTEVELASLLVEQHCLQEAEAVRLATLANRLRTYGNGIIAERDHEGAAEGDMPSESEQSATSSPNLPPTSSELLSPRDLQQRLKETHERLRQSVQEMHDVLVQLGAASRVRRDVAEAALGASVSAADDLSECLANAALLAPASFCEAIRTPAELDEAVERALDALQGMSRRSGRDKLQKLLSELRGGSARCERSARSKELAKLQVSALQEAAVALEDTELTFPGPDEDVSWLRWYWDTGDADVDASLEGRFEKVLSFLVVVQPSEWVEDSATTLGSQTEPPERPAASRKNGEEINQPGEAELEADGETAVVERGLSDSGQPDDGDSRKVTREIVESNEANALASTAFHLDESPSQGPSEDSDRPEVVAASNEEPAAPPRRVTTNPPPQNRVSAARIPLGIPTFSEFVGSRWMNPAGAVVPAPWLSPTFETDTFKAIVDALLDDKWALARVHLGALEKLGTESAPQQRDFEYAEALRAGQWPPPPEEQAVLLAAARNARDVRKGFGERLRIAVALAAPNVARGLTRGEIETLVGSADFSEPFTEFLLNWTDFVTSSSDAFAKLARRAQSGGASKSHELGREQQRAKDELLESIKSLHSAAGGKIQRTFCRNAWRDFIAHAGPVLTRAAHEPSSEEVRTEVGRLKKRSKKVFDHVGARFQDRSVMDRAVDTLLDGAENLIQVTRALDALAGAENHAALPETLEQFLSAPTGSLSIEPEEDWLRTLIAGPLFRSPRSPHRILATSVVERFPWVLAAWPRDSLAGVAPDVLQCDSLLSAAAALREPPRLPRDEETLRDWLLGHHPRLLIYFENLNEIEREKLQEVQHADQERLDTLLAQLRRCWVDLAELADPDGPSLEDARLQLEELSDAANASLGMVAACAELYLAKAQLHRERAVTSVVVEALESGVPEEAAKNLAKQGRYADLLAMMGRQPSADAPVTRATLFRREAHERWSDPRATLSMYGADDTTVPALRHLFHEWAHSSKHASTPLGQDPQGSLRSKFVEAVFDLTQQRRKTRSNPTRTAHTIACSDVADWLASQVAPPSFLPQLHRFRDLSVKCLPAAATDRNLVNKIVALGDEGCLTVVLAPGLPGSQREECRRYLRESSNRPVALLDDLDLCRIFNPGGQAPPAIAGLLETILEQQRWDQLGPYEVQEGQHIRMEMYVGRRAEADTLVNGTTYSRIFSGRRLGKTALLRYVEHSLDHHPMASGNRLRVLYIPIVGLESEHEVVEEIAGQLSKAARVAPSSTGAPKDRLRSTVDSVLAADETANYLVFLDEADTFFENQARMQDDGVAAEDSLSWRMRSLEQTKDAKQHPRIRFVVCGYRATNRSEGAWGNWGDVLLLNPLERSDAVALVTGPMARLGIDVRDQADSIAFRCGYQPAVIIYFCARLLQHMERRTPFAAREDGVVSKDDVVAVFQLPEVRDRIKETCWLNFVGEPLGQLTFAAFLAEAAELGPGAAIDDAPQRLIARIKATPEGRELPESLSGSWSDTASRHLRDLVKRSLLCEADRHPLSLRLRFPHQLPTLLLESPQARIQDALQRLKSRKGKVRSGWLITEDVLETARWHLSDEAWNLGVRQVVFGTHWEEPLLERTGLHHRLPEKSLFQGLATPDALDEQVRGARALVGGADTLRAALARRRQGHDDVEVIRLGRYTADSVESYFKRMRDVEFSGPGAIQEIMSATGGIPILLGTLAAQFDNGATIDAAVLQRALSALDAAIPSVARKLTRGPGKVRLDGRDIELLSLVIRAAEIDPDDLATAMEDADLLDMVPLAERVQRIRPLGADDDDHLSLLLTLGLLPRKIIGTSDGRAAGEVAAPGPDDALRRLLGALDALGAGPA